MFALSHSPKIVIPGSILIAFAFAFVLFNAGINPSYAWWVSMPLFAVSGAAFGYGLAIPQRYPWRLMIGGTTFVILLAFQVYCGCCAMPFFHHL